MDKRVFKEEMESLIFYLYDMEIEDFVKKFADCLNTVPATGIDGNTNFKKLEEWSSIFALIVIAMVDSEYGKTLTSDDIRRAETLHDLFDIIQSR